MNSFYHHSFWICFPQRKRTKVWVKRNCRGAAPSLTTTGETWELFFFFAFLFFFLLLSSRRSSGSQCDRTSQLNETDERKWGWKTWSAVVGQTPDNRHSLTSSDCWFYWLSSSAASALLSSCLFFMFMVKGKLFYFLLAHWRLNDSLFKERSIFPFRQMSVIFYHQIKHSAGVIFIEELNKWWQITRLWFWLMKLLLQMILEYKCMCLSCLWHLRQLDSYWPQCPHWILRVSLLSSAKFPQHSTKPQTHKCTQEYFHFSSAGMFNLRA